MKYASEEIEKMCVEIAKEHGIFYDEEQSEIAIALLDRLGFEIVREKVDFSEIFGG